MKNFLLHLFLPQDSNNHRAKILHHQSLFLIIAFLLVGQFFVTSIRKNYSSVLGKAIDISSQELLLLTNQKRQENNLSLLTMNDDLSRAALLKAKDMFSKNYWAHSAPDGTTPWVFFRKTGYDYMYAGENLARGFTSTGDVIAAWMASTTHKENILSKNYQEVGFTIMQGKLLGEETTLVVEMFGTKTIPNITRQTLNPSENSSTPVGLDRRVAGSTQLLPISVNNQPLINSLFISKNIGILLLSIFILVLMLDMIVVGRKRIARLVGHNLDHLFFLSVILIFVIILGSGVIL